MTRKSSNNSGESSTAFTSMIDIVFLLLIFFILQPFKAPEMRLDTPLDEGSQVSAPTTSYTVPVRITIRQTNGFTQYIVDGRPVGTGQGALVAMLRDVSADDETVPVVIESMENVPFGRVLYAMDQCRGCGMRNVRLGNTL